GSRSVRAGPFARAGAAATPTPGPARRPAEPTSPGAPTWSTYGDEGGWTSCRGGSERLAPRHASSPPRRARAPGTRWYPGDTPRPGSPDDRLLSPRPDSSRTRRKAV